MSFFGDYLDKKVPHPPTPTGRGISRNDIARDGYAVVLPGLLPWTGVVGRSESACVAVTGVRCWPEFAQLSLTTYHRNGQGTHMLTMPRFHEDAEEILRFGVLFADGRRATNLDHLAWNDGAPRNPPADHPVLFPAGGSGWAGRTEIQVSLFPLPPAGPVTLIVEWPAEGIAESRTEFDGAEMRAAAEQAERIW
ncbi:hypothetical protein [Kutzneria chonburiensis]|uniref:Uncharacterized protein n=2 Tax=Kutzneria chonburiensis TaxID=1483604 RepID=A0ABV6MZF6_9PSEU